DRPSRATAKSSGDFVEAGTLEELEGRRLSALATYRTGLERFPDSFDLLKSAGRLGVALGQANDPVRWLRAATAKNTTDAEVQYYLGLAEQAGGREPRANRNIESALRFRRTRPASALLSRDIVTVQRALADSPRASVLGAREVSLLRRAGRRDEALARARYWK